MPSLAGCHRLSGLVALVVRQEFRDVTFYPSGGADNFAAPTEWDDCTVSSSPISTLIKSQSA